MPSTFTSRIFVHAKIRFFHRFIQRAVANERNSRFFGGDSFLRDQNERVSYTLENVDLASSYLVSGPKEGLKIWLGK